jgi:hypothetical protein
MENCPNCKARIKNEEECYRCGFEFIPVSRCEEASEKYYRKALISLRNGWLDQAIGFCATSALYENSERVRKLRRFLSLKTLYHVQEQIEKKAQQAYQSA